MSAPVIGTTLAAGALLLIFGGAAMGVLCEVLLVIRARRGRAVAERTTRERFLSSHRAASFPLRPLVPAGGALEEGRALGLAGARRSALVGLPGFIEAVALVEEGSRIVHVGARDVRLRILGGRDSPFRRGLLAGAAEGTGLRDLVLMKVVASQGAPGVLPSWEYVLVSRAPLPV